MHPHGGLRSRHYWQPILPHGAQNIIEACHGKEKKYIMELYSFRNDIANRGICTKKASEAFGHMKRLGNEEVKFSLLPATSMYKGATASEISVHTEDVMLNDWRIIHVELLSPSIDFYPVVPFMHTKFDLGICSLRRSPES